MVSKHCCEIKRSRFVQIGKKLVGSYKKVAGIIERLCQNVKIGLPSKYKNVGIIERLCQNVKIVLPSKYKKKENL